MRSEFVRFRMDRTLKAELEQRSSEEGYPNLGRYFTALGMDDLIKPQSHALTKKMANASPEQQNRFIDALVELRQTDKNAGLSWLDLRIAEVVFLVFLCREATSIDDLKERLARHIENALLARKQLPESKRKTSLAIR